jgi:hypothetical protein
MTGSAKQTIGPNTGLLRRFAPRNDADDFGFSPVGALWMSAMLP